MHLVYWHCNSNETQRGSKQTQLELEIRFEDAKGVDRDLGMARKLYAKAASDSGGPNWVYSPPVSNGTKRAEYSGEFGAGAGWVDWAKNWKKKVRR